MLITFLPKKETLSATNHHLLLASKIVEKLLAMANTKKSTRSLLKYAKTRSGSAIINFPTTKKDKVFPSTSSKTKPLQGHPSFRSVVRNRNTVNVCKDISLKSKKSLSFINYCIKMERWKRNAVSAGFLVRLAD